MIALYRDDRSIDWTVVEVIGVHASGDVILRQIDRQLPGVWLAKKHQVVLEKTDGRQAVLRA